MQKRRIKYTVLLRYIAAYILVFLLPIFVLSAVVTNTTFETMQLQAFQSNEREAETTKNMLENEFQRIRNTVFEISANPNLYPFTFENDPYQSRTVIKTLQTYQATNTFVDHMFIYMLGDDYLCTATTTASLRMFFDTLYQYPNLNAATMKEVLTGVTAPKVLPMQPIITSTGTKNMTTMLFPILTNSTVNRFAVAGFMISESSINRFLYGTQERTYFTTVYDDNGTLLYAPLSSPQFSPLMLDYYKTTAQEPSGLSTLLTFNGKAYNTSLLQSVNDRVYIRFSSADTLLKPIQNAKNAFAVVFVIITAIGLVLALVLAGAQYLPIHKLHQYAIALTPAKTPGPDKGKGNELQRIYSAIETLNQSSSTLTNELKYSLAALKESFVNRLFDGAITTHEGYNRIAEKCQLPQAKECFQGVVIRPATFDQKGNALGIEVVFTALKEYMQALTNICWHQRIGQKGHCIEGILNFSSIHTNSAAIFWQLEKTIGESLNCTLSIYAGNSYTMPVQIKASFREADYIAGQSASAVQAGVFFYQEESKNTQRFLTESENQIALIISAGEKNDFYTLKTLIDRFVENLLATAAVPPYIIQNTLVSLTQRLWNILNQHKATPSLSLKDYQYLLSLSEQGQYNAYAQTILSFFEPKQPFASGTSSAAVADTLYQQLSRLIYANYMKYDFTLQSLADQVGLSVPYICQYYRSHSGMTILTQITNLKMEEAIRLLSSTATSISDIAKAVGYLDGATFTRRFKKSMGVTPSVFRSIC